MLDGPRKHRSQATARASAGMTCFLRPAYGVGMTCLLRPAVTLMDTSKRPVQLVNKVKAEIFQPYVEDAVLVIPRDNLVAHNDNLTVSVVYPP